MIKKRIMRYLVLIAAFVIGISSCEKYDDCTVPVVGVYETHLVGLSGPFDLVVSLDDGDNIQIDAPWLNDIWQNIDADTNGCLANTPDADTKLDITIHRQSFDGNKHISGDGFYSDYSIQLDYTITDGSNKYHYRMVGSKK